MQLDQNPVYTMHDIYHAILYKSKNCILYTKNGIRSFSLIVILGIYNTLFIYIYILYIFKLNITLLNNCQGPWTLSYIYTVVTIVSIKNMKKKTSVNLKSYKYIWIL